MSNLFDTGIRPSIDEHLLKLSKEKRDYGDYWSASQAGYCQRKVIFERLGVPHVETEGDARKQRIFTAGHIFHEWVQGLTKEAGLSIASEVELQDEDLMIRGHFDDLVLVGENLILYDYKTANSRSFSYSKGQRMSYYHKMQLGTYMYMLRNATLKLERLVRTPELEKQQTKLQEQVRGLTESRILKISKDDMRMEEQQLLWSEGLEKEILQYWESLNNHWKSKTLPKCTCADQEGGFMSKEKWNPYFYEGEPCSIEWYKKWKQETK